MACLRLTVPNFVRARSVVWRKYSAQTDRQKNCTLYIRPVVSKLFKKRPQFKKKIKYASTRDPKVYRRDGAVVRASTL